MKRRRVPARAALVVAAFLFCLFWNGTASALTATNSVVPDIGQTEAAIARYSFIASNGGWPAFPDGPTLEPGMTDTRVAVLRVRLHATRDYYRHMSNSVEFLYDSKLVRGIRRFQARHGLAVDGVVGPRTRAALNVPAERRAALLRLNLTRLTNLLPWPDRFVLVHVAAFEAAAMENGSMAVYSRAIVGRPTRQTPAFRSAIEDIVFNPYWNVPPKIARRDIAPKVRQDPDYLHRQGIRVFASWAANAPEIEPGGVDWEALPTTIKLRQEPGPMNALGAVKFLFPNPYDVYLHDTPNHDLFDEITRAFSSGCVRLERADDLARWLVKRDTATDTERVRRKAAQGSPTTVPLKTPVPVVFAYLTAWAGADGIVSFRDDIYRRDQIGAGADVIAEGEGCHIDDWSAKP